MRAWALALLMMVTGGCGAVGSGSDAGADAGVDGGVMAPAPDPARAGPLATREVSFTVTRGQRAIAVTAVMPVDPGPFPVVLVVPGFLQPVSQYLGAARRAASFGYVALGVQYGLTLAAPDHVAAAEDVVAVLDAAGTQPELGGRADPSAAAAMGHSLGGKLAVLAAARDRRLGVVIGLDPVDSGGPGCTAITCPDATSLLPLDIATAFLGGTLDRTGATACAPEADGYRTFHAAAGAPSVQVTITGAGHTSFLDDRAGCLFCGLCQAPSVPDADVLALVRAFSVAFLERHVRGDRRYDTHLTGAQARARWVDTGLATIEAR